MLTFEGKLDTDGWYPVVILASADGSAMTGVVFGDVTCKYAYEAAESLTTYSVTTNDWKESGEGLYWLNIGASEFDALGRYAISISVTDAVVYRFPVQVTTNTTEERDTVDTGFDSAATLKRILAILDGNTTVTGSGLIHAIQNKDASIETTHTFTTGGNRTVS